MNLLFIEDEPESIEPVLNLIKREQSDATCSVTGFDDAEDKITSNRPDIVILDLLIDGSSAEPEPIGLKTRDFIWERRFCPIIVYSAQPDIHDYKYDSHPFVKSIQKGEGSPRRVLEALVELRPQVKALHEAEEHILHSFAIALRDVAPAAFNFFSDINRCNDVILRAGRRRLASLIDGFSMDRTKLASWEQYLFPPVCSDTQLGDIIRAAEGSTEEPTSFRVVLTPSCDLVVSNGREPKVDNVLVARCCSMKEGLDLTSLKDMSSSKLKNRLPGTVLSSGYFETVIPFPSLEGRIPIMAADLRNLEFIPVSDIGISDTAYLRIASIDSPFREIVAWAYLQTACRPGLPDRDLDSWRDEIIALLESEVDSE